MIGLRMWLYFGRGGRGRLGGGPGQGGSCDGRWAGILIVVRVFEEVKVDEADCASGDSEALYNVDRLLCSKYGNVSSDLQEK